MQTVVATGAVLVAWFCAAAVLAGCGYLLRRLLVERLAGEHARRIRCEDLWLGLAALTVYLLVWNLFWAIGWDAWLLPAVAGVVGLASGFYPLSRVSRRGTTITAVALTGVGACWFANQSLGPAEDYDLGLYHLNLIRYAESYRAVPGLANLHVRLGTGDTHLLMVSFLDRGPWSGAGLHLANGLLATLLAVELISRIVRSGSAVIASFTERFALLLIPATFLLAQIRPTHRISSPNLDFAAYVLFAVGILYLAEWAEAGSLTAALTATATLALVSTSRPLYWLPASLALVTTAIGTSRSPRGPLLGKLRLTVFLGVVPSFLLLGWLVRQAVLSGYPFFPSTIVSLPVDWRTPLTVVTTQNRVDFAWARWAGIDPNVVLSSWRWLTAWWLPRQEWELDVVFPLSLLSCLIPSLASFWRRDTHRVERTRAMLVTLALALPTLVLWFFIAPDPRFAWGPIWIVPVALSAWALPTPAGSSRRLVAFTAVAALPATAALAIGGIDHITWLLPAALAGWALAGIAARLLRPSVVPPMAYASVLSVLVAAVVVLAQRGNLHVVAANKSGLLGLPPLTTPTLVNVQTSSGLQLVQPTNGGDQCWQVLLCVPDPVSIDPRLHMRGAAISDGFSVAAAR